MKDLGKAIGLVMEEFRSEFGEDAKLKDGDEVAAVFNDGLIILSVEGVKLGVKVLIDKPYVVDDNIFPPE